MNKKREKAGPAAAAFSSLAAADACSRLSRLASDLNRWRRTAELHRLIGNLFTASPQNNRGNKSRKNDSALHVHSPDEVKSPTEF